jgi:arsenate reductase
VSPDLGRRSLAEGLGTAFLVAAVVGSGIAARRLSPSDTGLELLENAVATGAALTALILALQPISAAFNPLVTLIERALGVISTREAVLLAGAQVIGGSAGAMIANLMFGRSAVSWSTRDRSAPHLWFAEVVASLGLMLVIFSALRGGRQDRVAYAVGGYITAAYFFTSSTSFANPAVTVARMLSDTFAGIAPASVAPFVAAQVVGAAIAWPLIRLLCPTPAAPLPVPAPLKETS